MPADAELDLIDVLETAPVGAIVLDDRDAQVLFWNTSVLAITGGLQGEAFARAATCGLFRDDRDFAAARARLAADGSLRNFETRVWREDGHESWATVSMRPIRFENNAATLIWYFDITEAKRRQHQLERSRDALLRVLDAAPAGAALTDGPGRICYWNTALRTIFPGSPGDPAAAIRAGVVQAHAEICMFGQGTTFRIAGPVERFVAGWTFDVEFEGAPAELLWLHDVTELRRAERTAKAATETKSAFLATMSHEIRTPMNGVQAIADLLAESPLNPDQAGMVRIIQQSAESLIRVINDILDFSKLESSQLNVEAIPFRLDEVLEGVRQLLLPRAAEKSLALELRRPGDGGTRIGDPLRLRQVLLNLVGNAVKFTPAGSVTLDVETGADDQVTFRVIDTGIGIPPDKMARLFTPYQQADVATARNYGGTGLGLSISNALVALMGGSLRVDSTEGQGSTFTVTLALPNDTADLPEARPAAAPDTRDAAEAQFWDKPDRAIARSAGAVILCAEDNATNRDVLGRVLDRLGFDYDIVDDGEQALAMLDRSRHGIVLTDGHMPNLDGWQLARAVRETEAANGLPRLPVMILTADAVGDNTGRGDPADIDASLTKPLRRDQLEAAMLQALPILADLRRKRSGALVSVAEAGDTLLDLRGLIDLLGDVRADLHAVLLDFHGSAVAQHERLSAAMAASDRNAVVMAAHALKGAAGYAGSRIIAEHAGALEAQARQGIALEALWHRIDALALAVARLPEEIEASLAAQFPRASAAAA